MERREGVQYEGVRRPCALRELRIQGEDGRSPLASGLAAVFDAESDAGGLAWFREVVRPGAFTKTVREADVRALQNHDSNLVLGRTRSKTLRIEERDGLYFEADFPETTYARDLAEVMRRGDVDQGSFSFSVIKERWTEEARKKPLRELLEVSLDDGDVSIVTFPWYPTTAIEVNMRAELRALVSRAKAGMLDDTARALLGELVEALREFKAATEPSEDHSGDGNPEPGDAHSESAEPRKHSAEALRLALDLKRKRLSK